MNKEMNNELNLENILKSISEMMIKTEESKAKFIEGTSQYSLQKNRLKALNLSYLLIRKKRDGAKLIDCTKKEIEEALKSIISLISKSEKAKEKLNAESWQFNMLERNLEALYVARTLLLKGKESNDY